MFDHRVHHATPPPAVVGQLELSTLESDHVRIVRARCPSPDYGMLPNLPRDDGYVMAIKLRPLHNYDLFLQGRHAYRAPIEQGGMCLMHLELEVELDLRAPFDILQFHFLHRSLMQSAGGDNPVPIATLRFPPMGTLDPVVNQLSASLLPAIEHPARASPLFVSHVTMALSAHLIHAYGDQRPVVAPARGGLSRWQERLAKDMLAGHLNGSLSMAALARECGLSPSHFAAAFKKSTGASPTAWLAEQRVHKARGLLSNTVLSLSEIALASGYADQAHFTHCFTRLMGMPPGAWRRGL
jgi:AraC-like DNA-binding protein